MHRLHNSCPHTLQHQRHDEFTLCTPGLCQFAGVHALYPHAYLPRRAKVLSKQRIYNQSLSRRQLSPSCRPTRAHLSTFSTTKHNDKSTQVSTSLIDKSQSTDLISDVAWYTTR